MKIVVIGGSGLIGSKVVRNLRALGHEVLAASPKSGVNTISGEGLNAALEGAQVVVDVSNSPSFEDRAVLEFFETSGRNLLAAEVATGVGHHVALSVVGADRLPDSGYMRAKVAQEKLIAESNVPYTIVRATQFFEFLGAIGQSAAANGAIHLPGALFQPMAAEDVATALTDVAIEAPVNGMIEIAGPRPIAMSEAVGKYLAAQGDERKVISDANASYFGTELDDQSLRPSGKPRLGATSLEAWLGSVKS